MKKTLGDKYQPKAKAKKATPANLPAGFEAVEAEAEAHDFDEEDTLIGSLLHVKAVTLNKGKSDEKIKRIARIRKEPDGELVEVWESGGNKALFDIELGSMVYIHFEGLVDVGKQQPMRKYVIAVKK